MGRALDFRSGGRAHPHSGQTLKPTSHPVARGLENLYQFKAFTERSS